MDARNPVTGMVCLRDNVERVLRPSAACVTEGASSSTLIAFVIVAITTCGFLLFSDEVKHWFVIPIVVCGVLIGRDAVEWARGRFGLYDPVGLLGVLGFHHFFLAPLLHVYWDYWMSGVRGPFDWRDWLGYMAILNVAGLVAYRVCRETFKPRAGPRMKFWKLDTTKFRILLPVCIGGSAAVQIWVIYHLGGIAGYVQSRLEDPGQLVGMGWILMIAESAPILTAFFLVIRFQQRKVSWSLIARALCGLFIVQMVFGGLRGSRSETVLLLFWAVGCIHLTVRSVPRKIAYLGCVVLLLFMYFYGFYKTFGINVAEELSASDELGESVRTPQLVLLSDLARADEQAFVLYKLVYNDGDFRYGNGRTYLGALALLIPHWLLPERPETKLKETTEIEEGRGAYVPGEVSASRVYGLAGESMLNFGPLSVPFAYALFGLFVGWFRNRIGRLLPGDARYLLVPFGTMLCLIALGGDSDNLIFTSVKNGLIPCLALVVCSVRRSQAIYTTAGGSETSCFRAETACPL